MTGVGCRWIGCAMVIAAALIVGTGAFVRGASAEDYHVLYDVGSLKASPQEGQWPNWSFAADVDIGSSNWVAVNVVNTDCFIGADDPRSGTANAGAIAWYAQLRPSPSPAGSLIWAGTLSPVEGTSASGRVTVTARPSVDSYTSVRVEIRDMEEFAQDNTFKVCIAGT
jgi:hypothetical protein